MTDIFTLGIKADTTDIDRGAKSLDNIANASDKAERKALGLEKQVESLSSDLVVLGGELRKANSAYESSVKVSDKLTSESKSLSEEVERLSKQFNEGTDQLSKLGIELKESTEKVDGLSIELKQAQDDLEALSKKTKESKDRMAEFRSGVNNAGLAITAFGVAGAAALGAITVSAGDAAKEIENLSRLSNLTAEEFQRSAFAARAFGVEQDKLSDIFKDAQDKIGDFLKTGGGPLVNFFEKIAPMVGVTADEFRGLSGKDGLQLYVDSLEKANLSQSEMVFFLEEIGNDATLLQPLLADGGKEFERLGRRADELNVILSDFDIQSLQDMNTSLREMGAISDATGNIIGATLAPFVTDLTSKFNDAAINGDTLRGTVFDIAEAGAVVVGVFANAGRVFEIAGTAFGVLSGSAAVAMSEMSDSLDLFGLEFDLWIAEFKVSNSDWVDSFKETVADGSNALLEFLGLDDKLVITVEPVGVETAAQEAKRLKGEIDELTKSMEDQALINEGLFANSWDKVHDLILKPIPSTGIENWAKEIRKAAEEIRKLGGDTEKFEKQTRDSKVGTVAIDWEKQFKKSGETMGALNTIFGKNEKAASALHKVNEAIALAEAITSIQKISQGTTEAAAHVANEGIKQSSNALTAISSAFAAPFPVNFAAGAAMIGIMASLGLFGGSGGGGAVDPTAATQDQQGTGTVFGSDDKSASIVNAQERFEDIAIDQLAELRGIRDSVNSLSSGIEQLAKSFVGSVGGLEFRGSLSGSDFNDTALGKELGIVIDAFDIGGVASSIIGGLSKTSKKVVDQGVLFISQSLGSIISQGIVNVDSFFEIETKKSKFFGLSKSTTLGLETQDLDNAIQQQMAAIFENIGETVVQSATLLGFDTTTILKRVFSDFSDISEDGFEEAGFRFSQGFSSTFEEIEVSLDDALKQFNVNIGKVSFEGLSGEEIQQELEAVFSQQADLIAEFLVPSIAEYQKIGEGLFDTLLRVTQEQAIFNDSINEMGISLFDLSNVMQIDIAQSILNLIGGAERFSDLTGEFFSEFFSEAEQFDRLTNSLTEALGGVGLAMFDTRDQFRGAIEALDLTTDAGQSMFASLLELVPAMDDFFDSVEADELEALAAAERVLSDERNAALKEEQEAARDLATQQRDDARLLSEQQREADKAARALAASILVLTRSLTDAAKTSLSNLAESIGAAQGDIASALSDTLSGIAFDFDSQRQSIFDKTTMQVSSMEMQLGLVNDRVSELAGLSGILSGSLSTLSGSTRGKARADIQSAIASGNAGQDLAGLGLQSAVTTLANIDQSSFGSSLELRLEQARTANELSELKLLTDGQLTQGELNAQLIEQQISAIENSSDLQIATLFELQAASEQLAEENSNEQIEVLNDILESAEEELNATLGIETGVLSLVVAQDRFRESIDALAMQITEQSQQAMEQASQAQASQAEANAAAANVVDNSDSNTALASIADNSRKTNKLLNRWDTDGQPEVRSAS